jgi:HSP20 family protein
MYNRDDQGGTLSRRPQGTLTRPQGYRSLGMFDPWREMEDMRRRMDNLFGRFFGFGMPDLWGGWNQGQEGATAEPDVDVYENDNEFIVQAALPGIDPQDIHVQATGNTIMINAESRSQFGGQGQQGASAQQGEQSTAQQQQQPHTQHRQSRYSSQRRFQFAYTLPDEVKPNEIRANFRNGMLEVHLPKAQVTQSRPVTIPIEGASSSAQPASSISGQGSASGQLGSTATTTPLGQQAPSVGAGTQEHQARMSESSTQFGQTQPASQTQPTSSSSSTGSSSPTGQP